MKKKNVISLIKYYVEKNDAGFRTKLMKSLKDLMILEIISFRSTLCHYCLM